MDNCKDNNICPYTVAQVTAARGIGQLDMADGVQVGGLVHRGVHGEVLHWQDLEDTDVNDKLNFSEIEGAKVCLVSGEGSRSSTLPDDDIVDIMEDSVCNFLSWESKLGNSSKDQPGKKMSLIMFYQEHRQRKAGPGVKLLVNVRIIRF